MWFGVLWSHWFSFFVHSSVCFLLNVQQADQKWTFQGSNQKETDSLPPSLCTSFLLEVSSFISAFGVPSSKSNPWLFSKCFVPIGFYLLTIYYLKCRTFPSFLLSFLLLNSGWYSSLLGLGGSNYVFSVPFSFLSSTNLISMTPVSSFQLLDNKCNPDVSWRHHVLWDRNKISSSPHHTSCGKSDALPKIFADSQHFDSHLQFHFPPPADLGFTHIPAPVVALSFQVHTGQVLSLISLKKQDI